MESNGGNVGDSDKQADVRPTEPEGEEGITGEEPITPLERVKVALRQRGVRVGLIAILAVVVLVVLISTCPMLTSPTDTIPNAPGNLTATAQSFSLIVLSWQDNSDNEDGFVIVRRKGAGGPHIIIAKVGADVTSYPNTGLSENTTYYYAVSAYNDAGNSGFSNEYSATTPISKPEYHVVGTSVQGQKQSLSVVSVTKTDRHCTLPRCLANPGTAFVAVVVSTTNHHSDILIVKRNDFILRDSATRDRYELFDYPGGVGALLGEPLPKEHWLSEGQTLSGTLVYHVRDTASLSKMEVVYVLDYKEHAWKP